MTGSLAEAVALEHARTGLEGDGVASHLFELLWKKDLLSSLSVGLRIPDTVLYKFNAPALWYFTSVDGTIKRKTKAKVNSERIYEEFVKKASSSGIVAYYVTDTSAGEEATGGGQEAPGHECDACTRTTIEYFDLDGLREFLFNRQRVKSDGILQKFIHPKGDYNNMLRALWSPKVCLLERKVNRRKVTDTRYDLYERAVTFEGPEFHSEMQPVRGSALITNVHQIAESMVEHVATVTNNKILMSRLALNFKVDYKDRLWLLFASSVRLQDELQRSAHLDEATRHSLARQGLNNSPLEMNMVLQVPQHVRRGQTVSGRPVKLQRSHQCPTCKEKVEADFVFNLSYKVMIEHDERRRGTRRELPAPPCWPPAATLAPPPVAAAVGGEEGQIPEVLQQLHPRLTEEEYARYRHDVAFLYKEVPVCEECYLRFSSPQLGEKCYQNHKLSKEEGEGAADADGTDGEDAVVIGAQELEPEKLRLRRSITADKIHKAREAEELIWNAHAQRLKKLKERAHSCPKLTSDTSGAAVWPPPPMLASRPPAPPQELPPGGPGRRPTDRTGGEQAAGEPLRRPPRDLPPLPRGDPYLRDLQSFILHCDGRANEVLGPTAAQSYGRAARKPVSARPPPAAAAAALPRPAAGGEEEEEGEEEAAAGEAGTPVAEAKPGAFDLELSVCSGSDGGLDASGDSNAIATWWHDTCGFHGGVLPATPTTRTPSHGDAMGSQFSSHPGTQPSSRTSSRPPSATFSAAAAERRRPRLRSSSVSSQSSRSKQQDKLLHLPPRHGLPAEFPSRPLSLRDGGGRSTPGGGAGATPRGAAPAAAAARAVVA